LSDVVSLESILDITENGALININGLSNLTSIGSSPNPLIPSLSIGNNQSLTNLDGLSKLATVGRDLRIIGNQLLVRFCGLYLLISSNGLTGAYAVSGNASNPTEQQIIDGGVCTENVCPTAGTMNVSVGTGSTINFQLQGSDVNNEPLIYSISQSPSHGVATTTSTGMASYTPTIGYVGTDLFKYQLSDNHCEAEGTANITVLICPAPVGYWKNRLEAWPANVTPMSLGTRLYTKTELLSILNLRPGNGNRADASLILASQEIAAKLNIANGAGVTPGVADSITSADALIGDNLIPMSVKPNTPLGQRMTAIAAFLASYNNGLLTPGCSVPATQAVSQLIVENHNQLASTGGVLAQNHPNPFIGSTTIRYALPEDGTVFYHVSLKVYDVTGREVKTLLNDVQNGGWKSVTFDARPLEAGTYFYRITANEFSEVRKMILLK
jgi:hypothetical protein